MHPNAQLITTLYTCFQKLDSAGMAACYHPEIVFSDPIFTELRGPQVPAMWEMLSKRAKNFGLTFSDVRADDTSGAAKWEATYLYSASERPVRNRISSAFTFRDGLIVGQVDTFDFWRWSGMALGLPGKLFGWLPPMRSTIQRAALAGLQAYMHKQA